MENYPGIYDAYFLSPLPARCSSNSQTFVTTTASYFQRQTQLKKGLFAFVVSKNSVHS